MKKLIIPIIILLSLSACKNSNKIEEGEIITKKIMYDVPIVNLRLSDRTTNNPDWFWENLPYPEGDKFIDNLYEQAKSGDIPIYKFDMNGEYDVLEQIEEKNLDKFFENEMSVEITVPDRYDEENDQYIKMPNVVFDLDAQRIHYLKFLEEWRFVDGNIEKKVLAVAPVFVINIGATDVQEAYTHRFAKFWIMADDRLIK